MCCVHRIDYSSASYGAALSTSQPSRYRRSQGEAKTEAAVDSFGHPQPHYQQQAVLVLMGLLPVFYHVSSAMDIKEGLFTACLCCLHSWSQQVYDMGHTLVLSHVAVCWDFAFSPGGLEAASGGADQQQQHNHGSLGSTSNRDSADLSSSLEEAAFFTSNSSRIHVLQEAGEASIGATIVGFR